MAFQTGSPPNSIGTSSFSLPPNCFAALDAMSLSRQNLLGFSTWVFPEWQTNWHHEILCRAIHRLINGQSRRLLINMPPRSGKTQVVSRHLPAWYLGHNPDALIMTCSCSSSLAKKNSRDVQRIIRSPRYRQLFPNVKLVPRSGKKEGQDGIRTAEEWEIDGREGSYKGVGVGQSIVGRGADLIVIDDPVDSAEAARSLAEREKVWEWYVMDVRTRLDKPSGPIIAMGTRWHDDDLFGKLLKMQKDEPESDRWEVIDLPAIADGDCIPEDKAHRQMGEPIWPTNPLFTLEELRTTRAGMTEYQWAALYQRKPMPEGGALFKEAWFHYVEDRGTYWRFEDGSQITKSVCVVYTVLDPACSVAESADFSSIMTVSRTPSGQLIVIDVVRERLGVEQLAPRLHQVCQTWNPAFVLCEASGFQMYVVSAARRFPGMPPIREVKHRGKDKKSRATPAIILAEKGSILFVRGKPWVRPLIDELIRFTGERNGVDDQADCLSYAALELPNTCTAMPSTVETLHNSTRPHSGESSAERLGLWGRGGPFAASSLGEGMSARYCQRDRR